MQIKSTFLLIFRRRSDARGGNQVQQVYLPGRRLPGEAEHGGEPAGELVHDGGGVVRRRDR